MNTDLYSLSKIFYENLFRIPDYQRGYSWTERQLKDFWSDIVLLDVGHDHYTGVLTLEEVNSNQYQTWTDDLWILQSRRYKPYYVVDGQQRLTTSLILLQALLEQLGSDEELNYTSLDDIKRKYIAESKDKGVSRSYMFGYERDNPSYEFLKTRIFMDKSDNHEIGEETIYTHNLYAAKQFFSEKFATMSLPELESVFTKITQHFLFNIYTISGGIDVFVAFETMNNRGKPLSHLELLKNRLIFLSTRLDTDPTERAKVRSVVNEAWKTAYHYLGRNQNRPLDDDRFLNNQFILYVSSEILGYNDSLSREHLGFLLRNEEYKSYLLDNIFTSKNIGEASLDARETTHLSPVSLPTTEEEIIVRQPLTTQTIYNYAHDLKSCVQLYYRVFNPEDSKFNADQKILLTRINRLGWYEALPLCLAVASNPKVPSAKFTEFLENLERYLFLRSLVSPQYHHRGIDAINFIDLVIRFKKKEATVKGNRSRGFMACALRIERLTLYHDPNTSVATSHLERFTQRGSHPHPGDATPEPGHATTD